MKKSLLTEQELIVLLKAKQKKGFDLLYNRYSNVLYDITLKIVHDRDIAQDVLQDSFVKVWTHIAFYEPSKGSLFTWLLNITRNTAIDRTRCLHFKNHTRTYCLDNYYVALERCCSIQPQVEDIGIKEGVAKHKPEYQLLVDYIYRQGYTQEQTAKAL